MSRMKKFFRGERGDILVLFALTLVFLVGMVALATDVGLLAVKRAHLMEVGQIMRDARLEQSELVWDAQDPAAAFDNIVREYGEKNGLRDDQIETTYTTTQDTSTARACQVTMIFHDTYSCTTLRLFGYNHIPITVKIDGSATKSSGSGVWSP